MRFLFLFAVALLLGGAALAQSRQAEQAAQAFYGWALAHPGRGLPSAKERAELAKVLTPSLVQLLKTASETEARCVKAAPKGDKPLIVEGDLFVGNYEGASEVAYGEFKRQGDATVVETDLLYIDKRMPKAHKHRAVAWKDRVELRFDGAHWLVQDVQFPQDRSLVTQLKAYIEDGRRACGKP